MSEIHVNDQIYALQQAVAACEATGASADVVYNLRQMLVDVQAHVRGGPTSHHAAATLWEPGRGCVRS